FAKVWAENWGASSYADYREILRYARESSIPLVALNAGKELRSAVRAGGIEGLDPQLAKDLPEIHPDDYHRGVTLAILAGHSMPIKDLEAFYRVQVLWDETMARSAADFLESPEGRGRRLVVLAGGNHVRHGFGIPRRLFLREPLPYVIVEPFVNRARVEVPREKLMDVSVPSVPLRSADIYWSVRYTETEKVMLGVTIEETGGKGVRVLGVMPASAGEKAGLRAGDVIVSIDGKPVRELVDLTFEVNLHKPGDTGPLEVERDGRTVPLSVTYFAPEHGK
ncbi:MAG: ChaN family lipoprotein, partial [Deltaproteobacteria bacterium]|nr:ChaN family lipoprotein [Deltaproteobacteria bacterium]